MAPAVFSWRWKDDVDARMAADARYVTGLRAIVGRLNDREASSSVLDHVVTQPWHRGRSDWYDAAALDMVGSLLRVGWLVAAIVPVGHIPGRDRDEDGNQRKLGSLSPPFSAWCAAGSGEDDGRLEWAEPVVVRHEMDGNRELLVEYGPSGVPLEIGHTNPETTIWHLQNDGGVARWPYGEDRLTLLLSTSVAGRATQLGRPKIIRGGPDPLPQPA